MTGAARLGLAALLLMGLAACESGDDATAQVMDRQQAIDPPQLWLVQVIAAKPAPAAAVLVCVDTALREGFGRARAEINGQPCEDTTPPLLKEREWVLSCRAHGRGFTISSSTLGDLNRDFRLSFAITPLFNKASIGTVSQSRRFQLIGACPAGWRIGDQARPGHKPHRART